jgi:hypothetical protein
MQCLIKNSDYVLLMWYLIKHTGNFIFTLQNKCLSFYNTIIINLFMKQGALSTQKDAALHPHYLYISKTKCLWPKELFPSINHTIK